ncbi:MFS transporter [Ktedonosporobacter rubrisoli]|nr:MFS transporter [Ktedonosporobacter rubrisoli]
MSTTSDTTKDTSSPRTLRPLWRNRDYVLLVSGQAVSSVGSQVSLVAFPLMLFALTHSALQTGLIAALRALPYALITLPAGVLVDRWDRKQIMIVADFGRALALGSIPLALWLGHLTYVQLYLVSLVEGTLYVFATLAESASLPHVVEPEQIPMASGQDQLINSTASLIGPALGPILYSIGQAIPFLADAISYMASVISLFFVRIRFQDERSPKQSTAKSLWTDTKEGIAWLWHNPLIRFLAILTFGLITPCYGYLLILIVLAQGMHTSSLVMGLIFAGEGVGSIIGSLIAGPLYRRLGFRKLLIGTAWIWAIFWLLYALAPNPLLLGIVNAVSFTVVPVYMVVQYSYRAAVIPDQLWGRVNSVFRLIAFSSQPLGIALTGFLVQWIGPVYTVLLLFVPQGIMCVIATFSKHIRNA